MSYLLGIDVGTTRTAAAIGRSGVEAGFIDPRERRDQHRVAALVAGDQVGSASGLHHAGREYASTWTRRAIASISTRPPFGSAATWTVDRAGGGSGMKVP